jgi:hypothetical protein
MAKGSAAREIQRVSIDPWYVRTWRMLARQRTLWRNLVGLLLIALGLITLVSLIGLNTGTLINRWVGLLPKGVGFGAFILCLLCIALGATVLLRAHIKFTRATLIRIICGELAFLALTHNFAFGSNPYELVQAGGGGGAVGIGWLLFRTVG